MQRFARTVRRDLDAVTNALTESWSNGQTEGQINRLKTLKRAMYGRTPRTATAGNCLSLAASPGKRGRPRLMTFLAPSSIFSSQEGLINFWCRS